MTRDQRRGEICRENDASKAPWKKIKQTNVRRRRKNAGRDAVDTGFPLSSRRRSWQALSSSPHKKVRPNEENDRRTSPHALSKEERSGLIEVPGAPSYFAVPEEKEKGATVRKNESKEREGHSSSAGHQRHRQHDSTRTECDAARATDAAGQAHQRSFRNENDRCPAATGSKLHIAGEARSTTQRAIRREVIARHCATDDSQRDRQQRRRH
ncbi:hypothetical protein MRX96_021388 [Rhipicephalus microplus]